MVLFWKAFIRDQAFWLKNNETNKQKQTFIEIWEWPLGMKTLSILEIFFEKRLKTSIGEMPFGMTLQMNDYPGSSNLPDGNLSKIKTCWNKIFWNETLSDQWCFSLSTSILVNYYNLPQRALCMWQGRSSSKDSLFMWFTPLLYDFSTIIDYSI